MAMRPYGGGSADYAVYKNRIVPGQAYEVWTASTGGSQMTGITDMGDIPLAGNLVLADQYGRVMFKAPDSSVPVYLKAVGDTSGVRVRMDPADMSSTVFSTAASIAGINGTVIALGTQVDTLQATVDASDLTAVEAELADHESRITTNTASAGTNAANIATNTTAVAANTTRLDAIEAIGTGNSAIASRTTNLSGSTTAGTETVVVTISNFLFKNNIAYRISYRSRMQVSTAGANTYLCNYQLRRATSGGTIIGGSHGIVLLNTNGAGIASWIDVKRTGGSDTTQTVVLTFSMSSSNYTNQANQILADATSPTLLRIEPLGLATVYTDALEIPTA